MLRSFQARVAIALLGLWAALAASPVRAGFVSYSVSMDTSSVQGQTGFLTMDFLPSINVDPAQAIVSGFYFDGSFLPDTPMSDGDVIGDLSTGGVTLGNSTPFNSYSQAMTFGTYLGFTLTIASNVLDTPDPLSEGGTIFAYYLFERVPNPDTPPPAYIQGNSLLTTGGPGDAVLTAELCDCGILTVTPYTAVVPEPGTITLSLLGGMLVLGRYLTRRRIY